MISACSVFADEQNDAYNFTNDAFFMPSETPTQSNPQESSNSVNKTPTKPPIKILRENIQQWRAENRAKKTQQAPTDPNAGIYNKETDTSEYASKDIEEKFDENMMPDGFEADEEAVKENQKAKHFWNKNKQEVKNEDPGENIVLDCDNMDYDTERYCLYATGNVKVLFVNQQTTVKADKITYDRMNNTIKAEGNVKIIKNGQTIEGDYIFVDMNEENALIENPVTQTATVEMRANKGYVYGDKIVQEDGFVQVDHSYPINFRSSTTGPRLSGMILPKNQSLSDDMQKGLIKVKAKEIIITQKGEHETIAVKHADVKKGKWTMLKVPAIKMYTNKNHDYAETNIWELGSMRDLGMYIGPGFVFELPKGSVLKAIPILTYNDRFGVGMLGRFNSGTNLTQAAYGTSKSKVILRGKQKLDDNLYFQYGINDYLDEWWLGKRRPKYGADLVYQNEYESKNFLLKNHSSKFTHRFDLGYYHDIDRDKHFKKLKTNNIGTTRARYMMNASQNLYNYRNEDKQTALSLNVDAQLSAALYGTGDTQIIGRVGPRLHTQWRRWMQDIGLFESAYEDKSPMPVFDAYRYGRTNVYLREYLRICKYLTVSWFGSVNLSGDAPNKDTFQENAFYVSVGPDDLKFSFGYDFIRENTFFTMEVLLDAKGTRVDYDKMVIKQDKRLEQEKEAMKHPAQKNEFQNSNKAPVYQRAAVEEIKTVDDVL